MFLGCAIYAFRSEHDPRTGRNVPSACRLTLNAAGTSLLNTQINRRLSMPWWLRDFTGGPI
jgi:hypothetical protein